MLLGVPIGKIPFLLQPDETPTKLGFIRAQVPGAKHFLFSNKASALM